MLNYESLQKFGGRGYSEIVKKIEYFNKKTGFLPENIAELSLEISINDSDLDLLEKRGRLERTLNNCFRNPKILLIKTHYKIDESRFFGGYLSDNDQIVIYNSSIFHPEIERLSNAELGLYFINKDFNDFINAGHALRSLGTNGRVFYIRPKRLTQLIVPSCSGLNQNNSGTLTIPVYHLEEVLDSKEDILSYCERIGLSKRNLRVVRNLFNINIHNSICNAEKSKPGILYQDLESIRKIAGSLV